MQGIVSGIVLVAAFAATAALSGLVAVRLYRVSGAVGRGGPARRGRASGAEDPRDA